MTQTRAPLRAASQFWNIVSDVLAQRVKRAEVELGIAGHAFIIVIYRVNEHVPVRVDFKPKGA